MTSLKIKREMRQTSILKKTHALLMLAAFFIASSEGIGIPDHVDNCKDEKYNNTYYYDSTRFECRPCGTNAIVDPVTSKLIF